MTLNPRLLVCAVLLVAAFGFACIRQHWVALALVFFAICSLEV